jgi:hypothetical protein
MKVPSSSSRSSSSSSSDSRSSDISSSISDIIIINKLLLIFVRWRRWLRPCATNRNVAGSIPDGVTGILHWHNHFGRTMALGSTHPLTEMSTRNISWGVKAAGV